MTIEPALLHYALVMGGRPLSDPDRAAELSAALGEPEEILPHVLLKRGGFSDWPLLRKALNKAAEGVSSAATRRPFGPTETRERDRALAESTALLRSAIDANLASSEENQSLDRALRRLRDTEATPALHYHERIEV